MCDWSSQNISFRQMLMLSKNIYLRVDLWEVDVFKMKSLMDVGRDNSIEIRSIIQCPATHYNTLYLCSISERTAFISAISLSNARSGGSCQKQVSSTESLLFKEEAEKLVEKHDFFFRLIWVLSSPRLWTGFYPLGYISTFPWKQENSLSKV